MISQESTSHEAGHRDRLTLGPVEDAMEQIGVVEAIYRYPVKSMAGEELRETFVGYGGLLGDRPLLSCVPRGQRAFRGILHASRRIWSYIARGSLTVKPWVFPANVETSFGMAPGVNPAYPSETAYDVEVTTPKGDVYPIRLPELAADLARRGEVGSDFASVNAACVTAARFQYSAMPLPGLLERNSVFQWTDGAFEPISMSIGPTSGPTGKTTLLDARLKLAIVCELLSWSATTLQDDYNRSRFRPNEQSHSPSRNRLA